jgi:hypothetical protein
MSIKLLSLLLSSFGSTLAGILFCRMHNKSISISRKLLLLLLFQEFHVAIKFSNSIR